jgi:hypothetical protein
VANSSTFYVPNPKKHNVTLANSSSFYVPNPKKHNVTLANSSSFYVPNPKIVSSHCSQSLFLSPIFLCTTLFLLVTIRYQSPIAPPILSTRCHVFSHTPIPLSFCILPVGVELSLWIPHTIDTCPDPLILSFSPRFRFDHLFLISEKIDAVFLGSV